MFNKRTTPATKQAMNETAHQLENGSPVKQHDRGGGGSDSSSTTSFTVDCSSQACDDLVHPDEVEMMQVDELHSLPATISARPKKTVRFDEERNVFHEHECSCPLVMTAKECTDCWYSEEDITSFRESSTKAANLLFGAKREDSFYKRWRTDKKNAKLLKSAIFCKKSLSAAYKECNGITTEEDFHVGNSTVDRKNLCKAYQDIDDDVCLMGLEVFILLAIRGESFHQVRYILGMVEQRMGGKEAMNANPLQRDQMMRLFSQYISLPSRVYVRELALAQAAVVKNEWNVK